MNGRYCSGGLRPPKFPEAKTSDARTRQMERLRGKGDKAPLQFNTRTNRNSAFTLIEILVVMVIITMVAALVVGVSKYAMIKAGTSRAQAEIAAMENAIENFKNENGYYPLSTSTRSDFNNNSASLYSALVSNKVYFPFKPNQLHVISATTITNIMDPFGNPYNYYCTRPPDPSQENQATFDLWSYGVDGKDDNGTNDDIANWKR